VLCNVDVGGGGDGDEDPPAAAAIDGMTVVDEADVFASNRIYVTMKRASVVLQAVNCKLEGIYFDFW
jgi:hypothetical protein